MTEEPIKISKDEINGLPLQAWEGPTILVQNDEQMLLAAENLLREEVLGFDTETRPSFRKGESFPAAILQLGSASTVYVIQLLKLTDYTPVAELLSNPRIIKAGVAIADDIKKLQENIDFKPAGFVEIADLTQKAGILNTGLRSLAGLLLRIRISKRAQVSNWARPDLTEAQLQYAATDAWISRRLYIEATGLCAAAGTAS
jgi:ribonuclease D